MPSRLTGRRQTSCAAGWHPGRRRYLHRGDQVEQLAGMTTLLASCQPAVVCKGSYITGVSWQGGSLYRQRMYADAVFQRKSQRMWGGRWLCLNAQHRLGWPVRGQPPRRCRLTSHSRAVWHAARSRSLLVCATVTPHGAPASGHSLSGMGLGGSKACSPEAPMARKAPSAMSFGAAF